MPQALATPELEEWVARMGAELPNKAARRMLLIELFKAGVSQARVEPHRARPWKVRAGALEADPQLAARTKAASKIRGRHAEACRVRVASWRDRLISTAPRLGRGEGDTAALKGAASPLKFLIESETAAPPDPDEGQDKPTAGARDGPEDERSRAHTTRRFTRGLGLDPDAPGAGRLS